MVNKFLYPRGGAESYMLKVGKYLEDAGHTVAYFGMYDEKNTVGNAENLYTTNMDFHSKSLERFLYPFRILYSREAYTKIGKVLDSFHPDIVHLNNINFQLTPSILDAIHKRNIPIVQTVHDYQMVCPNHLLYNEQEEKVCERCVQGSKWNCARYSCIHGSKVKSILGTLEALFYRARRTYEKVDCYICPSRFLEQKLLAGSPIYQDKTFVLHNFVNIQGADESHPAPDAEPYIAFVGRLSKEKGVALLAETAKLLPEYKFVVMGNGPDDAVLQGINNVELTGFLTGDTLRTRTESASLIIVPSICYENCPLSILEAFAFGVPVVTMNMGGMAELVTDGVNGTLAKEPTADALADAVRRTMGDGEYLQKLRENCQKTKKDSLTLKAYCEILLRKYAEICEQKNAKSL